MKVQKSLKPYKTKDVSLKDHFIMIRMNILTIFIITILFFAVSFYYAFSKQDIFVATSVLKYLAAQDNPLDNGHSNRYDNDRILANEIETLKNIEIREKVAQVIVDSLKNVINYKEYSLLVNRDPENKTATKLKSVAAIARTLSKVDISQMPNLDYIEIKAESPSAREAALIATAYATVYRDFNLSESRQKITDTKDFLYRQRNQKMQDLINAEDCLRNYQSERKGIELNAQANTLITQLADFESRKNSTQVDMKVVQQELNQYKTELARKDPMVSEYLNNQTKEPLIKMLQQQIAKIETQKILAMANNPKITENSSIIKEYNNKIDDLKLKLKNSIDTYQSKMFTSSPEEIKTLTSKIFDKEVKYQSLVASYNQLNELLHKYEAKFNSLPKRTLELARLERERLTNEKVYMLLEEKYQIMNINEQSTHGNIAIMNYARIPDYPAKPNRKLIIIFGTVLGLCLSVIFIYVRLYLDNTVKSPEDILKEDLNILVWIPKTKGMNGHSKFTLFGKGKDDQIALEAFKALRLRLQFAKLDNDAKVLLITSASPSEGKTTIAANLAVSFADTNKKTLLIDCDLRLPKLHRIFHLRRSPGLTNYLFNHNQLKNVIYSTKFTNLDLMPSGSIPSNPSELLASEKVKKSLEELRTQYDFIILDSPPIISLSDAEVLAHCVDMSLLVVSANSTEIDWMNEAAELLQNETKSFTGVLLNNYNYKEGYGSYYKYKYSKYYTEIEKKKARAELR